MRLSPAALLYLSADALAPKDRKLSMGVAVPCRDAQADLKQLSGVLVAAAFWSLREAGAVTIGSEAKKGLLRTKDRVAVRPTGNAAPTGPVEEGLLNAVGDKDPYAKDIVFRWLGRAWNDPWGAAVGAVENELADAGLVTRAAATGLKGKLGARPVVTPDCARIEAVRGEAGAALDRWRGFVNGDPTLAEALLKEARDGVDARLETD